MSQGKTARKHHVLVVDDSLSVRMALRASLHADGFTVTACESKASAQRMLKDRPFDLCVLDLGLDGGDGLDLLREIRTAPDPRALHVLLIACEEDARDLVRGFRVGTDDYVGDPCDPLVVVKRVRELLLGTRGKEAAPAREAADEPARPAKKPQADGKEAQEGSLLDRVVLASGLSRMIGTSTLSRACNRAGVDAASMSPSELRKALPSLRQALGVFVPPEELERRMTAIAALAGDGDGSDGEV